MTILVAHNRYRVRGGEDGVFETECRLLEEAGHRVIRYEKTNESISVDKFESSKVPGSQVCPEPANLRTCEPVNTCGAARKFRAVGAKLALALRTIWNPRTYREVRALIRAEKPTVVHCHNTFPLISPSIYWAASREGVPVVQTLHNYRLACLNGYLFREGRVCEACLGRAPWRGVCRRCYRDSRGQSAVAAAMLLVHRLLGTYRRKVSRYIALTDFARDKFVAAGLPAGKISVKPNAFTTATVPAAAGLKSQDASPKSEVPSPETRPATCDLRLATCDGGEAARVVYLGRLSPEKGVDVLLRAWSLFVQNPANPANGVTGVNDANRFPFLEIIGDGPERDALESLARELGIASRIRFAGALPRDAALAALSSASLLVLTSLCWEQFAVTPLEAMALGVPVLASDVARAGTILEDGVTGRFFRAGDPAALAAALRELLADPATLRRLGEAARAAFEASDCRPDRNLARLLDIYESVRR